MSVTVETSLSSEGSFFLSLAMVHTRKPQACHYSGERADERGFTSTKVHDISAFTGSMT